MVDMLEAVDVDLVLQRLAEILKTSSDRQLSTALGLSLSTVDANRKKGTLPYKAIVQTCKERGISLDSLFDIEVKGKPGEGHVKQAGNLQNNQGSDEQINTSNVAPLAMKALALAEKVMERELYALNIPADAKLDAAKKLRPLLIDVCFEHDFSESMVEMMAKGAVSMFK